MSELCTDDGKAMAEWYENRYDCPECNTEWIDEWSCMCNDRCPVCRAEIEPIESLEVLPDTRSTMELAILHAREERDAREERASRDHHAS